MADSDELTPEAKRWIDAFTSDNDMADVALETKILLEEMAADNIKGAVERIETYDKDMAGAILLLMALYAYGLQPEVKSDDGPVVDEVSNNPGPAGDLLAKDSEGLNRVVDAVDDHRDALPPSPDDAGVAKDVHGTDEEDPHAPE